MYEMQQCQRILGVDFLTTCVQKAKMHADRDGAHSVCTDA